MKKSLIQKVIITFFLLIIIMNNAKSQTDFLWGKQYGTDKEEYTLNHVIDQAGFVYISGKTTGAMAGANLGGNDGFITKIDSSGKTIWSRQFGTAEEEDVLWSAIDSKGNVYITGSTKGAMTSRNFGKEDIFVIKFSPSGKKEWTKQFGTDSTDIGNGIYSDNKGFIYVAGQTSGKLGPSSYGKTDGFIMKLDTAGNKIITVQFGTESDDFCFAITGDNKSGIYVCGSTFGEFVKPSKGMMDAYVGCFSDKGDLLKYSQFGTDGFDMALQLITDEERNIYVGGSTSGSLGCEQIGDGDCFLTRINPDGKIVWTSQFGTNKHDGVRGICYNQNVSDNILISGLQNLPPARAFVRMHKKDGSLLWERKIPLNETDGDASGKNVTLDNKGNIYLLGLTGSSLYGPLKGEHDIFLVKFALPRIYMKK